MTDNKLTGNNKCGEPEVTTLREKTIKQEQHPEAATIRVSEYTLGLRRRDDRAPAPLYESGRPKQLGEQQFWAFLVEPDKKHLIDKGNGVVEEIDAERTSCICYHPDEIGVLYADAPVTETTPSWRATTGMFPYVVRLSQPGPIMTLPLMLGKLMYQHNLTQKELGLRLDITAPQVSGLMSGKRKLSMVIARRLYKNLGADAATLLMLAD